MAPVDPWAPENTCKSLDAKTRGNKTLQKEILHGVFRVLQLYIISGKLCLTWSRSFDEHWRRLQHWEKLSRCTSASWWCKHQFFDRHILLGAELTGGLRLSRLLGLQQDVLLDLKTHKVIYFIHFCTQEITDEPIWFLKAYSDSWFILISWSPIQSPDGYDVFNPEFIQQGKESKCITTICNILHITYIIICNLNSRKPLQAHYAAHILHPTTARAVSD